MSLDYIYNRKSFKFDKKFYYLIGSMIVLIIVLAVYFIFRQSNTQQSAQTYQNPVTTMTQDQKLSILQSLDQTSNKTNQLTEAQKLNLLKSLH